MTNRMQNFVFNRNGGQPGRNVARPSPQTTREVEALAARIKPRKNDFVRSQRSIFSTDVESIGNTTTGSLLNELKDENDRSLNGGFNIASNEDGAVEMDDEVNHTRGFREVNSSFIESVGPNVRSVQENYFYQKSQDESQDKESKGQGQKLYKDPRNAREGLLIPRSAKLDGPLKENRSSSEEALSSESKGLVEVIPDSQIRSTDVRSRGMNASGESVLGSDHMTDICQDPAQVKSNSRKRDFDLDYPEEDLRKMSFQELASEDFDRCPQGIHTNLPGSMASMSLQERIDHVWSSAASEEEGMQHMVDFFSSMKIQDYEDAGDEILEQFQRILNRFKQLRREKRAAAVEFEKEIASRDHEIKERKDVLSKDLARFKRQGNDVLHGTN